MSGGRTALVGLNLSLPEMAVDPDPFELQATELMDLLREHFDQQGELAPPDPNLLALARVATGFLRTSPLPDTASEDGRRRVLQSLVATSLGWWTRDLGDYPRVAALLDDVFRQRETAVPDGAAMEMLVTVTTGVLRQRRIPSSAKAPQLAIADWLASIYLAGLDDW